MIEQCSVSASSQILLRLAGCGDAASGGACARNRTSVRRSSLISGGSAVAARKLVGMGGGSDTILARYICSNIASMDQERPRWKGVIRGRPRIRLIDMLGVYNGGVARTSGPIPKLVRIRGTFRYELRNQRTTSNHLILVRFNLKLL